VLCKNQLSSKYAACFWEELETATEGKCQQAINSGVGESMARNRLFTRRSLGEEGQLQDLNTWST
jgi:hypothetical protein